VTTFLILLPFAVVTLVGILLWITEGRPWKWHWKRSSPRQLPLPMKRDVGPPQRPTRIWFGAGSRKQITPKDRP
jgi:hypothetical protein